MKDRVPLYPGRVKLTPVSEQENTYDMIRADEPTQEGTPLNKATLLKDTTAALYGLGADAVPDDVLVTLYGLYHNATSFRQLWENASPGSGFSSQTLELDLTGYQLILLVIENRKCFFVKKQDSVSVSFTMTEAYPNSYNTENYLRTVTLNDSSVVFENAWYQAGVSGAYENNNRIKPLLIYGIKGVKTS